MDSWNSSGQNTGVGSLSFLQGIFPTQGSNPGLPHCRQILYQLSHKGSPGYLKLLHLNIEILNETLANSTHIRGETELMGFPGASDGKEFTCSVGDLGSIPR